MIVEVRVRPIAKAPSDASDPTSVDELVLALSFRSQDLPSHAAARVSWNIPIAGVEVARAVSLDDRRRRKEAFPEPRPLKLAELAWRPLPPATN